jgi:hypothetical protein
MRQNELWLRVSSLYKSVWVFVLLNIMFLSGTAYVHAVYVEQVNKVKLLQNENIALIIDGFNLGNENNMAAWYSSILLLSVAFLSVICFWIDSNTVQGKGKIFSGGWLFITALFVLLSFDEMGSLHENAGRLKSLDVMGDRSWESVVMIPGILVLFFMLIFSWLNLRHYITTVLLMLLGAIFFISVPVQEHFEIALYAKNQFNESWRRPAMHFVFEEGSELLGSLCFYTAFTFFIRSKLQSAKELTVQFQQRNVAIFFAGLLLCGVITYTVVYYLNDIITSSDGGTAYNWPVSALAFGCFIFFLLRHSFKNYRAIFFLVVSAYFGTNFYSLIYWDKITILITTVELILFSGFTYFVYTTRVMKTSGWRVGLYIGGGLLASTFCYPHMLVLPIAYFSLLLLLFCYSKSQPVNLSIKFSA